MLFKIFYCLILFKMIFIIIILFMLLSDKSFPLNSAGRKGMYLYRQFKVRWHIIMPSLLVKFNIHIF